MNYDHLLRCPACRGALRVADEAYVCVSCAKSYAIVNGIPRFVAPENYAANFGFQWNRFSRTQLDGHTGLPISRQRFLDQTGWTAADLEGKRVLDAGCGAGRFAEVALSLGAEVFAIDYSSAVEACARNIGDHPRLHVFQADIYALPFEYESFDFVYSLGVLQHTPDVERALRSLPPFVKAGGAMTVDLYLKSAMSRVHPRTVLRPVTTRMDAARLFAMIERWAPRLMRVSRAVSRVPAIGRYLKRLVPVANYDGILPLNEQQMQEWAVLDTFDWLAPKYDQPQTAETLQRWLTDTGLRDVQVFRSHHLTGRAKKS